MLCQSPYMKSPGKVYVPYAEMSKEYMINHTPFPCGKCINCRINYAKKWTVRILLEQLNSYCTSFVTLTYDDEFLPPDKNLCPKDVEKFMKRIRYYMYESDNKIIKKEEDKVRRKIRYLYTGEYGDENQRPHYHIAFFNIHIEEKKIIEKAWSFQGVPIGIVDVGDLNKDSARYIAGYIIKGKNKKAHYSKEFLKNRMPEFMNMSRNPGIGMETVKKIAESADGYVDTLDMVKFGKMKLFFDGYARKELRKMLDNEDNVEYEKYWYDLYDQYYGEDEYDFKGDIVKNNKQRSRNREVRFEIFNSARRRSKV